MPDARDRDEMRDRCCHSMVQERVERYVQIERERGRRLWTDGNVTERDEREQEERGPCPVYPGDSDRRENTTTLIIT